jgi:aconitate hydratase
MGVLPLQYLEGQTAESLGLTGHESFTIEGIGSLAPRTKMRVRAKSKNAQEKTFETLVRVDTPEEVSYYRHGGILLYVLRQML